MVPQLLIKADRGPFDIGPKHHRVIRANIAHFLAI